MHESPTDTFSEDMRTQIECGADPELARKLADARAHHDEERTEQLGGEVLAQIERTRAEACRRSEIQTIA